MEAATDQRWLSAQSPVMRLLPIGGDTMYKLGKSCTHDKVNNTFTVDNIVLSAEQAEAIAMAWMNRDCKQNEQLCEIDKMQVWSSDPRVQRFT